VDLPTRQKYQRIGWITAVAVTLLLVGVACAALRGTCYFEKICVEWNGQVDRDEEKLDQIVMRTEWAMGHPITPFAEIIFVPQLPSFAQPHGENGLPAPAWFESGSMLIYVLYIADLAFAPIGHELFHRELTLANDDADVHHVDPRWANFCGTLNNPCPRG
jgi:hypothetical protein